jgi:hypothetical protein
MYVSTYLRVPPALLVVLRGEKTNFGQYKSVSSLSFENYTKWIQSIIIVVVVVVVVIIIIIINLFNRALLYSAFGKSLCS